MPSKSVHGVAYTSLVTLNPTVFEKTLGFYSNLQFRIVKNYLKSGLVGAQISSQARLTSGISPDLLRELWLELFPLQSLDKNGHFIPWQNLLIYRGDGLDKINEGTILKLRLVDLTRAFDKIPSHQQLYFFLTNLGEIVKSLLAVDAPVDYDEKSGVLTTVDPIGNSIKFINKENINSEETFSSADDYITRKIKNITEGYEEIDQQRSINSNKPANNLQNHNQISKPKKKIAVMTSGGDAPGMNAAVRAVVRAGIYLGCDVYAVYEGYTGLVTDQIKQLEWGDVRLFLSLGGTAIGTARCMEFKERPGRVTGAYNLIKNGVDALIVCGGDGSLTGADLFRAEWPLLVQELLDSQKITKEQADKYPRLTVAGLVGSIDNDMAMTDSTIGAASSLARIAEMIDYIDATANSHSRAFVVEVMGRHCGWLGLMAGLASGADYIFIPERPANARTWQDDLKDVAARHRKMGSRKTTVIVAEGAIDDDLNPITAEHVKNVLVELGLDTRITTLGHVQRGGTAVAHDRMLATLQGLDAVKAVLESSPDTPLPMIGILENKIIRQPLVEAVAQTKKVAEAISKRDFDGAIALRDTTFKELYSAYLAVSRGEDGSSMLPEAERLNIGVIHVGASSLALNAATRAAALYSISRGHKLFGIYNGFLGLITTGKLKELLWLDVWNWHNKGGSELGTNRLLPSEDFGSVAFYLQKYSLDGLIIVGGFEAFTAAHELQGNRHQYPIFNIPTVVVPATVLNNVPGTEYSLGTDTCLNQLVDYCDAVKQSASSSRRRVFVVEVQGGHSGFVALYAGLVTGAIATYTPEDKIDLHSLQEDIKLLTQAFENERGEDRNGKMMIRNEQASLVYSSQLIADILKELSKGRFETRTAIPGHVQQGFTPSALDRVNAVRFLVKLIDFIEKYNKKHGFLQIYDLKCHSVGLKEAVSSFVIGIQGAQVKFSSVEDLYRNEANVTLRKGKTVHWKELAKAADMLSGRLMLRQHRNC